MGRRKKQSNFMFFYGLGYDLRRYKTYIRNITENFNNQDGEVYLDN